MDAFGQRIIFDNARAGQLRRDADRLEAQAQIMRREANEIKRLLELAMIAASSRKVPDMTQNIFKAIADALSEKGEDMEGVTRDLAKALRDCIREGTGKKSDVNKEFERLLSLD